MASSNPDRDRLKQFFSVPDAAIPHRWDDLWIEGTFLPFDRHRPNPALDEALQKTLALSNTDSTSRALGSPLSADKTSVCRLSNGLQAEGAGFAGRKTALVPGCGRGYDVLLLAAYGYRAVGLEISKTAVQACEELRESVERALEGQEVENLDDDIVNIYRTRDEQIGRGTATFVAGDFFSNEWITGSDDAKLTDKWDLVYDYTFLSALPVSLRPKWAARMSELVKPNRGRLLCVEFPTYKEPSTGGPPWALPSLVYVAHLGRPGVEIEYDADGSVVVSEEDQAKVQRCEALAETGMVRMAHWKAEKTHEIGKGTDHIGIWKLAVGS